jgi:glutathione S-transferase
MAIELYDLTFRRDLRLSPYCWRVKFALAHKGLDYSTIPVGFGDKNKIAFSGQGLVPVIVDGETVVCDSWEIAQYLDRTYPDTPRLFDSEQSRERTLFLKLWCERMLQAALFRVVALDIYNALELSDQDYFRQSREKRIGMRLEDFVRDVDGHLQTVRLCLEPLRAQLKTQDYLDGQQPGFGDYLIASALVWAYGVSRVQILEKDDPVDQWRRRLFAALGGLAARATGTATGK